MKKTSLLLINSLIVFAVSAQTPQALNYQAIARNSSGQIIPSQNIGIRFTITDATSNTIFYQETHNTITNAFGLFTLAIGKGTAVSGSIPTIDWSAGGDKYLKVEIAPQGGTNYTIQGTTQLLSVPYALYAEKTKLISGTAITITNGNTINSNYQAGPGITIAGNTISATAANSWLLNGNTGVNASDFLGTINNESLRFRTFNQERVIVDVNGNVGVNTQTPSALLHTKGTLRFEGLNTNNTFTRILSMDANGNVASRDANTLMGTDWNLLGNSGTTAVNFLGTTDNQPLYLRTNNTNRITIDAGQPVTGGSLSTAFFSDFASIRSSPAQLAVYGKDVNGVSLPMHLISSVEGMNWAATGGTNNTLGRFFRLTQMNSPTYSTGQFFDFGIDQGISLYISNRGLNSVGGLPPKKMFTISPQDYVGINFNWSEDPTANFHTKGTLRFEGVNTNNTLTRILAMDVNGNVASRDASTLTAGGNNWSLAGNSGTTTANFLGTTDDQRLAFRTNNIVRMYLDKTTSAFGADIGTLFLSDEANIQTRPGQLAVFGRDIAGGSFPFVVVSSVNGSTWGVAGGNTLGRLVRFSQMNTSVFSQSHFYDLGISQDSSFYLGNHGFQGTGAAIPKKMITISPQDMVGINLDFSEKPKSRLHIHDGDIYIDQVGAGVIMKSPNGQCWRMTVSDTGMPVFTVITCP